MRIGVGLFAVALLLSIIGCGGEPKTTPLPQHPSPKAAKPPVETPAAPSSPENQQTESQENDGLADSASLRRCIDLALLSNPEIRSAKLLASAMRHRIPQARSLEDPMVMAGNVPGACRQQDRSQDIRRPQGQEDLFLLFGLQGRIRAFTRKVPQPPASVLRARAFRTRWAWFLSPATKACREAKGMGAMRAGFALVSDALTAAVRRLGHAEKTPLLRMHCPMAFNNRGASWLQRDADVRNPYFGRAMLQCGEKVEEFAPQQEKP